MTEHDAFVATVLADPTTAPMFADWLQENGLWTWEHLLSLVIAHPKHDSFRLLAAQWQEECGSRERAEFIRVQCELSFRFRKPRGVTHDDFVLIRRERELLEGHQATWVGQLASASPFMVLLDSAHRRGFIAVVQMTANDWLAHAGRIVAATPLEEVRLTTWPDIEDNGYGWCLCRFDNRLSEPVMHNLVSTRNSIVRELLDREWPHLTFYLPRTVAAVVPSRAWTMDDSQSD